MRENGVGNGILAVDVGGTGLKAAVIDDAGKLLADRVRVPTPHPCPPAVFLDTLSTMVAGLPPFDRIAIGFPGVVRDGRVLTAPNLGTPDWAGFGLVEAVAAKLGGHPARMINDAEMQGYGIIKGEGLELVVTLGTGCGTALFRGGDLMPHMELAHHPIHEEKTYDEWLGRAAMDEVGKKHWSKRVHRMIEILFVLLHYDRLYLGGGNAKHVQGDLPPNVTIASNEAGLEGGAALWRFGAAG
jgi:polyphosphate glucokinase